MRVTQNGYNLLITNANFDFIGELVKKFFNDFDWLLKAMIYFDSSLAQIRHSFFQK
jgi:hypothetical protein